MANIKVELSYKIADGQPVTFVAPCNCNEITGLKVYYPEGSKVFTFKDAHGNDLTGIGNLFSAGVYVKAILDVTNGHAYIQNADTNGYLESTKASVPKTVTGEVIAVNDSVNAPLFGLKLYGKTIQNGTPLPESPADIVGLGPAGTTTTTINEANELVIAMRQIGSLNIDKSFDAYVGKVSYEMDYRIELNGCMEVDPNVFVVRGIDSAGNAASILNVKLYIYESGITFGTYDAGGENPISTVCEEGKKYRVKAVLDPETDTYELFVDGKSVLSGRKLRCNAASFNGIRLTVHRSGGRTVPKIFCDNIAVAGQFTPLLTEDFSGGLNKWSIREASSASAKINDAGQLEVTLNAGHTQDVQCTYVGDIDSSQKTAIDFDLKVNGNNASSFEAGLLLQGTATAVNVGVYGGLIHAQYSAGSRTFANGRTYHVKVITDPQTATVSVYVDGAPVVLNAAYVNNQTTWKTLKFNVKNNDSTSTLSACFDNLVISQASEAIQNTLFTENFPDAELKNWSGGMSLTKTGSVIVKVEDKSSDSAQMFAAFAPNGLPGIPVSSGGNYTDARGQQWVCDEVDFARGVYSQKVYKYTLDGTESIGAGNNFVFLLNGSKLPVTPKLGSMMSTHWSTYDINSDLEIFIPKSPFTAIGITTASALTKWIKQQYVNGNPVELLYILKTPVETPIPAEECALFAALHSYAPKTLISNAVSADMEVTYCTPSTAVPMAYSSMHAGKLLAIDGNGNVVPKDISDQIKYPVTSVNGKTGAVTLTASSVGAVPTSRTVNGKKLSGNISLTASDVGARPNTWTPSASDVGAVPTSRKINNKALSADISLSASDVGARPSTWTPSASDVGAVPTSRTVNGKALSSNISLTASDVGARPNNWTPTATDVGAMPKLLTSAEYGTSLPAAGTPGRIFFKKVT